MRRSQKKPFWYHIEDLPEYPALSLEVCFTASRSRVRFGFPDAGPFFQRYQGGAGPLYVLANDWDRASRATLRLILKRPERYFSHDRKLLGIGRRLERTAQQVEELKNLRTKSNAELSWLFVELQRGITDLHHARMFGWIMEQRFERFTAHCVRALERQIRTRGLALDPALTFARLAAPIERVKLNDEEESLLRIATRRGVAPRSVIERHRNTYWYLTYGMVGPGLTLSEIRKRITEARRGDPKAELKARESARRDARLERQRLLRELRLPKRLADFIRIAGRIGYEKAWSKEIQFFGQAMRDRVSREIGRRFDLTLRQIRWMLPDEVRELLEAGTRPDRAAAGGPRPSRAELDGRWRDSGLLITRTGMQFLRGAALRRFLRKNALEKSVQADQSIRELRGMPAFAGQAAGAVRIIESPGEMKKMRRGDILVSHMTIPEIVPAMRMAGAIVTDIGGLTCHAAIVSRELGIPCIIGTKVATKVLKDGDRVEVNATRGVVRKL